MTFSLKPRGILIRGAPILGRINISPPSARNSHDPSFSPFIDLANSRLNCGYNASIVTYIHREPLYRPTISGAAAGNSTCKCSLSHNLAFTHLNYCIQLYPSFDSIIILNARTLAFVRALAVWEAFPGALHTAEAITCLSVDPGMRLVRAAFFL